MRERNRCKLRLRFGLAILFLLLAAWPARAQFSGNIDIAFTAAAETLTVGDPVPLTLSVTYPADYTLSIPTLPKAWGDFEIRRQTEPETVANPDGTQTTTQTIEVTLFAVGTFQTPAWRLTLRDATGKTMERVVPQVSLTVQSVLEEGDTQLRDIKPQADLPLPPVWPWVAAGLALVALLAWLGRRFTRRLRRPLRRSPQAVPPPPIDPRPPHEIALAELARIEALDLPGQGRHKEYYTLVGDCLRRYLQGMYHIPAMDMTTAEIKQALRHAPLPPEHARRFTALLSDADLVKFARLVPPLEEARALIPRAREAIHLTRPIVLPASPAKAMTEAAA